MKYSSFHCLHVNGAKLWNDTVYFLLSAALYTCCKEGNLLSAALYTCCKEGHNALEYPTATNKAIFFFFKVQAVKEVSQSFMVESINPYT